MNLIGTIIKETNTSVLFQGSTVYDDVFEGREIWWPLSQVTLFSAGDNDHRDTARLITTRWIAERKATEIGRASELAIYYAKCEELERDAKKIKKAKSNGKKAHKAMLALRATGATEREAWLATYGHYSPRIEGVLYRERRTPQGDILTKVEFDEEGSALN